jgi:DNA adenine methylase
LIARGTYTGGKGCMGVVQALINQAPPHRVLVVPFAGKCAFTLAIRPAAGGVVLVDADADVVAWWRAQDPSSPVLARSTIIHGCGIELLERYAWHGDELVFADPPYLPGTRMPDLYAHELTTADHRRLLRVLEGIPCPVMLCGRPSEMYTRALPTWRTLDYTSGTRGGPKPERLWMNYPEPVALHDYSYLGSNFRERERIKRLRQRWRARLAVMPAMERYAVLASIAELGEGGHLVPSPAMARPAAQPLVLLKAQLEGAVAVLNRMMMDAPAPAAAAIAADGDAAGVHCARAPPSTSLSRS